jgi:hypothetical protein
MAEGWLAGGARLLYTHVRIEAGQRGEKLYQWSILTVGKDAALTPGLIV